MGKRFAKNWSLTTQKLTNIHLHSHLMFEIEPNGSIKSVYIFSAVGILILLLAIINYITLTTSLTIDRSTEIGVRKTLGAGKGDLIIQFIIETILIVLIALIISFSLTGITLPFFNNLLHQSLTLTFDQSLIILLIGLFLILIGCGYPAIYFSSFQTRRVMSKSDVNKPGDTLLRKGLVVAQFSIAIVIIAFTLLVNHQLHYVMNKNMGFNKAHVLMIPLEHTVLQKQYPVIKNEFSRVKGVEGVTASNGIPGNMDFSYHMSYHHKLLFEVRCMAVDYNFLHVMHIHLLSGRNFSKSRPTDLKSAIIVNEAAAKKLKGNHLMGKGFGIGLIRNNKSKRRIVGVVKNFHYRSLYYPVQPMLFYLHPSALRFAEIKLAPGNISKSITGLKQKWQQLEPGFPFVYQFLRNDLQQLYQSDQQLGNLFDLFSFLAIFIACMGLFGLASYATEKRTKEIGIRKVLGASVSGITALLSKDFLKLVGIGFLIATPIAWYAMHRWLQNFAYHIHIGIGVFLFAGLLAMIIALATVSWQSIRAALMNPVESLRNE
jgi:putative ABC transport system permease protein